MRRDPLVLVCAVGLAFWGVVEPSQYALAADPVNAQPRLSLNGAEITSVHLPAISASGETLVHLTEERTASEISYNLVNALLHQTPGAHHLSGEKYLTLIAENDGESSSEAAAFVKTTNAMFAGQSWQALTPVTLNPTGPNQLIGLSALGPLSVHQTPHTLTVRLNGVTILKAIPKRLAAGSDIDYTECYADQRGGEEPDDCSDYKSACSVFTGASQDDGLDNPPRLYTNTALRMVVLGLDYSSSVAGELAPCADRYATRYHAFNLSAQGTQSAQRARNSMASQASRLEQTPTTASPRPATSATASKASSQRRWQPPRALSSSERKQQYRSDKLAMKRARRSNSAGLKARRRGHHAKALRHYQDALRAAPGHVPSRFNLACEYALRGNAESAVTELKHLFRIGSPLARRFLSATRWDPDFNPIRSDPRIQAIAQLFEVKLSQPVLQQLCEDAGKIDSLVDAALGLYTLDKKQQLAHLDASKARRRAFKVLFGHSGLPGMCTKATAGSKRYRPQDLILSQVSDSQERCLQGSLPPWSGPTRDRPVAGLLCFLKRSGRWIIGVAASGAWSNRDMNNFKRTLLPPARKL